MSLIDTGDAAEPGQDGDDDDDVNAGFRHSALSNAWLPVLKTVADLGNAKTALELLAAVANIAVEVEQLVQTRSLARGYLQEIPEHIQQYSKLLNAGLELWRSSAHPG